MARKSTKSDKKIAIPAKSLEEAVQTAVQYRDTGRNPGEVWSQLDPESQKPFHQLIQQPEEFWTKFSRGDTLDVLLDSALKPKSEETVKSDEWVKEVLTATEYWTRENVEYRKGWILADLKGRLHKVSLLTKGDVMRYEGEMV